MKAKFASVLLALGALVFGLGSIRILLPPVARTRLVFGLYRASYRYAPPWLQAGFNFGFEHFVDPIAEPFEPVWMELQPGIKMQLDPYDLVSSIILQRGAWEPESVGAMAGHLSPGATFVDVGAHIGYYSLQAARIVGATGQVLAIEPNPQTLPKLRGNIAASNARAAQVWPVACAETESTLQLYAAARSNTGETSLSKANASQDAPASGSFAVRARPLDAIVKEAGLTRVDVIKIDVEGAELQVLKGAAGTLAQYHPVVIIELVESQLKAMGSSVEEVTRFLGSLGYSADRKLDVGNFEFVARKASARVP